MPNQPLPSQTIKSSLTVVESVISDLIAQTKNQATSNKLISRLMNPFTSEKVNSTINEIGNLIYEEAQDSQLETKFNHFIEVDSPKYMQKDNMFTNGVVVNENQDYERETSKFNKDERLSVQSFKTNFSKLPIHVSSVDNIQSQKQPENVNMGVPFKKRYQNPSNPSQLISLEPQSSNQNRTSAFNRSQTQNIEQRVVEVQINEFRQQKLLEQQNRKKTIQKQKKMTNLLSNDQAVITFDYTGDFIKKTKRELAQLIYAKDNRKIVQTGLLIKETGKFWKSKNNKNTQYNLGDTSSTFTANNSNINQLRNKSMKHKEPIPKRTTIQKIQELKKKSILIDLKTKISSSTSKSTDKKGPQLNSIPSVGTNGQKLSQQEQVKLKQHHLEFLSRDLDIYHQNEQNFMPQWVEKVEKGCKMTIFIGDGEKIREKKGQKQKQTQTKTNRSISDRSERTSKIAQKDEKQILQAKKTKHNGNLGNLHEVKHIQNLKIGQLSEADIIDEWDKRVHIKSMDNKPYAKNPRKTSSNLKNSRTLSLLQSKQISKNNTNINGGLQPKQTKGQSRVNISKEIETLNDKPKTSEKSINASRYETIQDDDAKSHYSFSNIEIQPKTKLNLNKKQFEKLKKYLKNKNSFVTKNDTIKKDSMEFFLLSQKKQPNKLEILKSSDEKAFASGLNHSVHTQPHIESKIKQSTQRINEQEEQSTVNQKRLSEKHRRLVTLAWKPRSFSVNDRRYSPCKSEAEAKTKAKVEGSIRVNNEKLKHTLLKDTIDFDLSRSSILNPNQGQKSRLKSSSSQIKWELTDKSRLKSIRHSEKRHLSTESGTNSSKIVAIPQTIHFNEVGFSRTVAKQTPKTQSTSIVVNKPRSGIAKTNFIRNAAK